MYERLFISGSLQMLKVTFFSALFRRLHSPLVVFNSVGTLMSCIWNRSFPLMIPSTYPWDSFTNNETNIYNCLNGVNNIKMVKRFRYMYYFNISAEYHFRDHEASKDKFPSCGIFLNKFVC